MCILSKPSESCANIHCKWNQMSSFSSWIFEMKIYCFHCLCSFDRTEELLPNERCTSHYYTNQIVCFATIQLPFEMRPHFTAYILCTNTHAIHTNELVVDLTVFGMIYLSVRSTQKITRRNSENQNLYRSLSVDWRYNTWIYYSLDSMNETNFPFEWCRILRPAFIHSSLKILRSVFNHHT